MQIANNKLSKFRGDQIKANAAPKQCISWNKAIEMLYLFLLILHPLVFVFVVVVKVIKEQLMAMRHHQKNFREMHCFIHGKHSGLDFNW